MGKQKNQQFDSFKELGKAMGYEEKSGKPVVPQKQSKIEKFEDLATCYRCPTDTRELVEQYYSQVDNFSLKLNHFAQFKGDKFKFFDDKKLLVKSVFNQKLVDAIQQRQEQLRKALFPDKELYKELKFSPDWRLIVGLGNESVYETSITLHHIYGIPYIPASAIKGVTRNCAINSNPEFEVTEQEKEEKLFKDREEKAFKKSGTLCDIFGCDENSYYKEAREGKVIFFDAFPINLSNESIQPDVMNVHYPDYYGKDQPPTDTQNPTPICFLTVQNTSFQFIIGIKKSQEGLLNKTTEWLKNALEQRGIGAKTAVGYGYLVKSNK